MLNTPDRIRDRDPILAEMSRQRLSPGARKYRALVPWFGSMWEFVHRKNIEHYRNLLAQTAIDVDRPMIEMLLADEEAKEPRPTRAPEEDD